MPRRNGPSEWDKAWASALNHAERCGCRACNDLLTAKRKVTTGRGKGGPVSIRRRILKAWTCVGRPSPARPPSDAA